MTKRSKEVMGMLKNIAEKEVDEATEALAVAMRTAEDAQSKYDMLVEYNKDYDQSFKQSIQKGIGLENYQNFQQFFAKLNMAMKGQLELLENAKQQVTRQKQRWKETQRKKISFEVLSDRYDDKDSKQMLKKEQNASDEFAMRKQHQKGK